MKNFPPQSAARVLTNRVPLASSHDIARDVLNKLRQNTKNFSTVSYTYILSNSNKLIGVVAIKSLLKASDTQTMKEIMTKDLYNVHPYTDQEKASILAIQHNIKAVPVVDKDNTFLGVIPTDRILEILHREHIEDILKLSGLDVKFLQTSDAVRKHTSASIRMRLPWLILGLFGGLISTFIVSNFQDIIQQLIALAFFIPIITYMSGAIANQTLSMLIRNIIMTSLDIKEYLLFELFTGTLLGALFGLLLSAISYIWIKSPQLSLIIILTMIANASISTLISALIPWGLSKLKKDPALAAGPFAIVIQDMTSLLVYFSIASLILSL